MSRFNGLVGLVGSVELFLIKTFAKIVDVGVVAEAIAAIINANLKSNPSITYININTNEDDKIASIIVIINVLVPLFLIELSLIYSPVLKAINAKAISLKKSIPSITFWGINLEDIAAPNCFYIEEELKNRLNIPVFHDDQHGTAVVVLAWLINALKLKWEGLSSQKIVISGAWAAAIAIGKLLKKAWAENIIFLDSKWAIYSWRDWLNKYKEEVAVWNKSQLSWSLDDVIWWADIFIWVSKPGLLHTEHIQKMAEKPIIFALANPTPEIMPDEAKAAWAFIVATGRSDFPNQVNNVLAFPGIFRGALDARIPQITDDHKIAAAHALANAVKDPDCEHIIPSAFDEWIANIVAEAVKNV